jgi:hypothetical protein
MKNTDPAECDVSIESPQNNWFSHHEKKKRRLQTIIPKTDWLCFCPNECHLKKNTITQYQNKQLY